MHNLEEKIENPQLEEIDKFIEDIYELRKEGLATGSEFDLKNLVFKEIRNKGYLDNLKELKNKIIGNELSLHESLKEDFRLFESKNFDKLFDEGDHGSNKLSLINAINTIQKNYITKSAEKFNIGDKSYNKWKAVLHHINGDRADNNLENLVLILDNTDESPKYAEIAHKLLHLYAAANSQTGIKDEILKVLTKLDNYIKYIMLISNNVTEFNFIDWWSEFGNILENSYLEFADDEIINSQQQSLESLEATVDLDLADNRQPINNNSIELKDAPYNYKKETAKAKGLSVESLITEDLAKTTLQEDNEFGKYKAAFIKDILQLDQTALHKGAESRKIFNRHTGKTEEKLLWDSVLHHNDGNHDNNTFDFSNYTLIQCNNYSTALFIHRLIHLLGFAENGNIAEAIKEKIKSYKPEFITLLDNQLNIQDFDAWWNTIGNIITGFIPDKIVNMQPGKDNLLDERLEELQRIDYRNELSRIAFNQAVVQDNGLFHIYNIKEIDVDRIVNQIRNLDYIEWAQKAAGRFDFSKVGIPGSLQPRIYEIYGKIKN